MVLSYKGIAFPLFVFIICLSLCVEMKIQPRSLIIKYAGPVSIAIIIFLLKSVFYGLSEGLNIASRILGAVSILILTGYICPFSEFCAGLYWFKVPRAFIEVLLFADRYILLLFEEAAVIYNSQKNRLGYSSLKRGVRAFGVLSGALILNAFTHSYNITTALVARGYEGNIPIAKNKPFKTLEIIGAGLLITIMAALWKISAQQ